MTSSQSRARAVQVKLVRVTFAYLPPLPTHTHTWGVRQKKQEPLLLIHAQKRKWRCSFVVHEVLCGVASRFETVNFSPAPFAPSIRKLKHRSSVDVRSIQMLLPPCSLGPALLPAGRRVTWKSCFWNAAYHVKSCKELALKGGVKPKLKCWVHLLIWREWRGLVGGPVLWLLSSWTAHNYWSFSWEVVVWKADCPEGESANDSIIFLNHHIKPLTLFGFERWTKKKKKIWSVKNSQHEQKTS